MTENFLPTKAEIIAPSDGWKSKTYYKVMIAFNEHNPIHESIFYSGFLHEGEPASYNQVWNPIYDRAFPIHEIFYLKVIGELFTEST
jgi:hypothetical protein